MPLRTFLRDAAYRSGLLRALSAGRLQNALTVTMFHRVVDASDQQFADADPSYSVSADVFEALLRFFHRHFAIVSLNDVLDAARRERKLPRFPLLITFDDGWRDNLTLAAPILASHRAPAVVFAAVDPILSPSPAWWQELVFFALRTGAFPALVERARRELPDSRIAKLDARAPSLDTICEIASWPANDRDRLLFMIDAKTAAHRMMLLPDEVRALQKFGVKIGSHGATHLPLTRVADLADEFSRARTSVLQLTGDEAASRALAFPHGRYDDRVIKAAFDSGYEVLFSSDPILNPLTDGFIDARKPFGRINMVQDFIVGAQDRLSAARAATWLWRRAYRAA